MEVNTLGEAYKLGWRTFFPTGLGRCVMACWRSRRGHFRLHDHVALERRVCRLAMAQLRR